MSSDSEGITEFAKNVYERLGRVLEEPRSFHVKTYEDVARMINFSARANYFDVKFDWVPETGTYHITCVFRNPRDHFCNLWYSDSEPFAQPVRVWARVFAKALETASKPLDDLLDDGRVVPLYAFITMAFGDAFRHIPDHVPYRLPEVPKLPQVPKELDGLWTSIKHSLLSSGNGIIQQGLRELNWHSPMEVTRYVLGLEQGPGNDEAKRLLLDFMSNRDGREGWDALYRQVEAYQSNLQRYKVNSDYIRQENERLSRANEKAEQKKVKEVLSKVLSKWFGASTPEDADRMIDGSTSSDTPGRHAKKRQVASLPQGSNFLRPMIKHPAFTNPQALVTDNGQTFLTMPNPILGVVGLTVDTDYDNSEVRELKDQVRELTHAIQNKGDAIANDKIKDLGRSIDRFKEAGIDKELLKMMKDQINSKGGQSVEMKMLLSKMDEFNRALAAVRDEAYKDGIRRLQDQVQQRSGKPSEEMKAMMEMLKQFQSTLKDVLTKSAKPSPGLDDSRIRDLTRSLEAQIKLLQQQLAETKTQVKEEVKRMESNTRATMAAASQAANENKKDLVRSMETQIKQLQQQLAHVKVDQSAETRRVEANTRTSIAAASQAANENKMDLVRSMEAQIKLLQQQLTQMKVDQSAETRRVEANTRNSMAVASQAANENKKDLVRSMEAQIKQLQQQLTQMQTGQGAERPRSSVGRTGSIEEPRMRNRAEVSQADLNALKEQLRFMQQQLSELNRTVLPTPTVLRGSRNTGTTSSNIGNAEPVTGNGAGQQAGTFSSVWDSDGDDS